MSLESLLALIRANWMIVVVVFGALLIGTGIGGKSSRSGASGEGPARPIRENMLDQSVFFAQILGFLTWTLYYVTLVDPTRFKWPIQGVIWIICGLFGFLHPISLPMLISWITPRDPLESVLLDESKRMAWYGVQKWTTYVMTAVSFLMLFFWIGDTLKISGTANQLFFTAVFTVLTSLIPSFAWIQSGDGSNLKWRIERMREARALRALHAADIIQIKADAYITAAKLGSNALFQVVRGRPDAFVFVQRVFEQMNELLVGIQRTNAALITGHSDALDDENERVRKGGLEVVERLLDLQDVLDNKMVITTEKVVG